MADKPNYDPPPDNFPSKGPSRGSGSDTLYSIQARMATYEPQLVCGHLLDLRWTTLHFPSAPIGVPQHRPFQFGAMMTGLMSYQAAQALRWWFHAEADKESCGLCLETRLIEHRVRYEYSSEAVRAVCLIGGDNSRSNIMPVEDDRGS